MNEEQLKGKIFEELVKHYLASHGYDVIPKNIQNYYGIKKKSNGLNVMGRGAYHQIDALGQFQFQIPFVYPIRLFSEAKCTTEKVGLPVVRNFVGVLKDISENYFINTRKIKFRFTDCGVIFSTSPFTKDAQMYAYAQGVYLVYVPEFLEHIENLMKNPEKDKIIRSNMEGELFSYFGIASGFYPILIISKRELPYDKFTKKDEVKVKITYRYREEFDNLDGKIKRELLSFIITIEEREKKKWEGTFHLPRYMWEKYLQSIDFKNKMKGLKSEVTSYIDIPMNINGMRRIIRLTLDKTWLEAVEEEDES